MAGKLEVGKYVEQTLGLLNNRKDLKEKDVNEKFKEAFPKWKQYFKLYKDSMKIAMKMWPKYSDALNKFEENYNSIYEGHDNLKSYSKELIKAMDETGAIIGEAKFDGDSIVFNMEKIVEKIKNYFASAPQAMKNRIKETYGITSEKDFTFENIVGSYENAIKDKVKYKIKGGLSVLLNGLNDQRKEFNDALKKIRDDFATVKKSIGELTGILNTKSMKRNIFQISETSPLKILKELHDALKDNKDIPLYKGKDLLKMPKKLNKKVESSMEKVINIKWGEYAKRVKELGMKDLSKSLKEILEGSDSAVKEMDANIKFLKEIDKAEPSHVLKNLEKMQDGVKVMATGYENEEILSLLSKVLAFKLGASVVYLSIEPLNNAVKEERWKDVTEIMARALLDKTPSTLMNVFAIVIKTMEFFATFAPLLGPLVAGVCKLGGNVIECLGEISDQAGEFTEKICDIAGKAKDMIEFVKGD